jgi:hypothetical protein
MADSSILTGGKSNDGADPLRQYYRELQRGTSGMTATMHPGVAKAFSTWRICSRAWREGLKTRRWENEEPAVIDWLCWLLLLIGLLLAIGSRFLHRRMGLPRAAWLAIGMGIALGGAIRLDF